MTDKTDDHPQEFRLFPQRIYIKGSNFESPLTPGVFKETVQSAVNMELQTNHIELEPNIYEAILSLNVVSKAEEKILWRAQLQQAGIFAIENMPKEQLEPTLYGFCMNLLYPYASEAIFGMIARSGFQPVYLTPINFETQYRMQQHRRTNITSDTEASRAEKTVETVM